MKDKLLMLSKYNNNDQTVTSNSDSAKESDEDSLKRIWTVKQKKRFKQKEAIPYSSDSDSWSEDDELDNKSCDQIPKSSTEDEQALVCVYDRKEEAAFTIIKRGYKTSNIIRLYDVMSKCVATVKNQLEDTGLTYFSTTTATESNLSDLGEDFLGFALSNDEDVLE